MKIAMCASEVVPFAKTGGLADVAGALPLALEEGGEDVIIVMPAYKEIKSRPLSKGRDKIQKLKGDISYSLIGKNIKVYFIEKDEYFNRDGLYGTKEGDYKDNLDRFSYYCRRTLELLKEINFKPDIIHVHDWQTCLVSVYLKTLYADEVFYKDTRTVLTIHNIGYQGLFAGEEFPRLGLDGGLFNIEGLEFYGQVNILKAGILFSDIINTVSPTYSKEIQTAEFGFGLEGVLNKRRDRVFGILNGLDYSIWNPETDQFIIKRYSLKGIKDKDENKKDLQEVCKLPLKADVPLLGMVSRLAGQKGLDILSDAMEDICKLKLQIVILGTGEARYHAILEEKAKKYAGCFSLHLKFDNRLAHKIYAGSDIFLMPSHYEPCGLGQMISLRYGTIPLVYSTGGLADTINNENGFVFAKYNKDSLVKTVKEALGTFADQKNWMKLVEKAMSCNFSWAESAKEYLKLYARTREKSA